MIDWGIVSVPQTGLGNRTVAYPAGKTFGGSSARNILAYQRATKGSFQKWTDEVDDQSYVWDMIFPFFTKSVNFTPPNYYKRGVDSTISYNTNAYNISGGPLHASYSNYFLPSSSYVRSAFRKLGLQGIAGLNNGELLGYAEVTASIDPVAQTRSSSETSFLQAALAEIPSNNFQVYEQTLARRILFNANKTATGVMVSTKPAWGLGRDYVLSAGREVILSCGAFRSPQMLMVSGIGPSSTLESFSVPVIVDSPGVGQNLQDQPFFGPAYRVNVTTQSRLTFDAPFAAGATMEYLANQTGPLANPGTNFIGWEKLPESYRGNFTPSTAADLASFPADWPELELIPIAASLFATFNDTANYVAFGIGMMTHTSRGNVTINSTNTEDNPILTLNYFATETDRQLAIQGFKRARELAQATGITVGEEASPGLVVQSDDEIMRFIESAVAPFHHASCTCKMGTKADKMAVIDSSARVLGVNGLRVVDASAFPFLPPGHCQSAVCK